MSARRLREWYGQSFPQVRGNVAAAGVAALQKLHLVGFTTDHRALILSARRGAKSGGFVLAIDDAVAQAVADGVERAGSGIDEPEELAPAPPPRPESNLSVRELQARLRAGRSLAEVAAEAGVDVEWVERFAAPVVAEQRRMIEAARNAVFSRARLGPSDLPLGAAVRRNLAARGVELTIEELDGAWSARQIAEGRWVVTLEYRSRGRTQSPAWELDARHGTIEARDRLAADLAFVPGAPAVPPRRTAAPKAAEPTSSDRAAARRVAEARKVAEAQLDEAARRASRRDAEVARRGPRPPAAEAAPSQGPARGRRAKGAAAEPAPTKAGRRAATSGGARPAKATAAKTAAAKEPKAKATARPSTARAATATARPATARAAKATARPATARAAKATATAPARRAQPVTGPPDERAPDAPAHRATAAAGERAEPVAPAVAPAAAGGPDVVAQTLAAVRRELEAEIDAFAARSPARPAEPAEPAEPAPRREGRVVRTPIDLTTLGLAPAEPAPAERAGGPVFRGPVAPAGGAASGPAGNGTEPAPPAAARRGAARPPRTRPLRAR